MLPRHLSISSWSTRTDQHLRILALVVIAISVVFFWYFAFISPSEYLFPDAFYYDAVADNLKKTGILADPSTSPPKPIYTPQNGIVFINAAVSLLSPEIRQPAIAGLGLFAWAASGILIFRICLSLGLGLTTARLAMAASASSPLLLRVAAAPLNDIFFIALFLSGLFSMIAKPAGQRMAIMAALALVMGTFRLQGVVLFIAASLCTWRTSRREAAVYALLTLVNLSLPFLADALLSGDSTHTRRIAADILSLSLIVDNTTYMLGQALPKLLMAAGPIIEDYVAVLLPIGAAIYILIAWRTWTFIRLNERKIATISTATLGTLLFVLITPYYDPRYYLCVYPFIFLVLLFAPWGNEKIRDTILVCACFLNFLGLCGRLLVSDVDFSKNRSAAAELRGNITPTIPLYSEDAYLGYFVFQRPSMPGSPLNSEKPAIALFGRSQWRARIARQLEYKYSALPRAPQSQLAVRFAPKASYYGVTILNRRDSP